VLKGGLHAQKGTRVLEWVARHSRSACLLAPFYVFLLKRLCALVIKTMPPCRNCQSACVSLHTSARLVCVSWQKYAPPVAADFGDFVAVVTVCLPFSHFGQRAPQTHTGCLQREDRTGLHHACLRLISFSRIHVFPF